MPVVSNNSSASQSTAWAQIMAFPAIADTADRRRARRQERESDCGCQAVMEPLRTASPSPDEEWRAGWARTRWYPDPTYAQLGLGSGRRLASGPLLAWHSARPSLPDRSHWRLVATTIANDPCPPEKCNPPRGGVDYGAGRRSGRGLGISVRTPIVAQLTARATLEQSWSAEKGPERLS